MSRSEEVVGGAFDDLTEDYSRMSSGLYTTDLDDPAIVAAAFRAAIDRGDYGEEA